MAELTALEKNHFNERFLEIYKQRLTGKIGPVIPDEGLLSTHPPSTLCHLGGIGPLRNPDYDGPQAPSSMGQVLLITPDEAQQVRCRVSGRFDVVHRYIPDLACMRENLLVDGGTPRPTQAIPQSFKRYTITFKDVDFLFSLPTDLSLWKRDTSIQDNSLNTKNRLLLLDPRVYKNCNLNASGRALMTFDWSENIADQDAFNMVIRGTIFADGQSSVLSYQVEARARIRQAPPSLTNILDSYLLEIYLVNSTDTATAWGFGMETPYLLDCEFSTAIIAGTNHKLPHKLKPEDYRHIEYDGLDGYGITCAVERDSMGNLKTNSLPVIRQWDFETPSPHAVGMSHYPSFVGLANDPIPKLADLLSALQNYAGQWEEKIKKLEADGQRAEAKVARSEAEDFLLEISRIQKGCALLASEPQLKNAFCWMNEVMHRAIQRQGKSFTGWRLFQIGFILTQIEAIFERHVSGDIAKPSWDIADVLWFSTGGGKTEAYLGVICMAMFYQRINSRTYGTTAWLRFPLRMLSVQQFQRLSYVVAQANILRQDKGLEGHPFTIGYFTGSGTPSMISSSREYNQRFFLPTMSAEMLESLKFIKDCPYCDAENSVVLIRDNDRFRLKHVCTNPDCWSNTTSEVGEYGEGIRGEIGIYVSDEECYRYLPSVLVGTIDKLAVIAHNVRFSKFFGSARHFCPEHGFTRERSCEHYRLSTNPTGDFGSVKCGNNSRTSSIKTVDLPPMIDPGFSMCIQDELHLLKETLGNFDGHYETLLQVLQKMHGGKSPKILTATATIKDYAHHVHHLYQKHAIRYPSPGIHHGESFYSRRKYAPDGTPLVRRYFTSFLPVTQRNPSIRATSDASTLFFDLVDDLVNLLQTDPARAEAWLNIPTVQIPATLKHLEEYLNTNLIYVNQKRSISEISRYLEEANLARGTNREWVRLDGESTLEEIQNAISHIETKVPSDPKRQMIATSVVSHGVDIERLNFMILAGWPTSTAEYIQSSARAGRVHPGIIVTVLSYLKLFEYNVFLNFADFHQFLDKMVESVPINRFAPNILDRTLPGLLSAVILNWASCQSWAQGIKPTIRDIHRILNEAGNPARREIESTVLMTLSVDDANAKIWFDKRVIEEFSVKAKERVRYGLKRLETWSGGDMDMSLSEALSRIFTHGPLRSFRDIENQIAIQPTNAAREAVIEALGR